MKPTLKGAEPQSLAALRQASPNATWDDLRAAAGVYDDLKDAIAADQGRICAYCEIEIDPSNSLRYRVEHFHSKGVGVTGGVNWALQWNNLLGVCLGGSNTANPAPHYLSPLPNNLSCDAHKQHLESIRHLPIPCYGHVADPRVLPPFPRLVTFEYSTGKLLPDPISCAQVQLTPNGCGSTADLVAKTIVVFNLNCDRLCDARKVVARRIEHMKKEYRARGLPAPAALPQIAARVFQPRWPGFFTTARACLGSAAENHLLASNFLG